MGKTVITLLLETTDRLEGAKIVFLEEVENTLHLRQELKDEENSLLIQLKDTGKPLIDGKNEATRKAQMFENTFPMHEKLRVAVGLERKVKSDIEMLGYRYNTYITLIEAGFGEMEVDD